MLAAPPELSDIEPYRTELIGYCYRLLGSGFEAEDAVQETLIKAMRARSGFEGRSSVRSWLYRIATNVCIDMTRQVQRRARPMEMGPASPPDDSLLGPLRPEATWITPLPDSALSSDPADVAEQRESVRLAFISALQHLPPRQRAALVLCDVLQWPAAEAADLLGITATSVSSSLQRARATLKRRQEAGVSPLRTLDNEDQEVLDRYVEAFQGYDMRTLASLLHDDAIQSMPPFAMWLQGPQDITLFMLQPGPSACWGSKLLPTRANGCPAFGQYKRDPMGGFEPWAIQVLEVSEGKIAELAFFLNSLDPERLFPAFGLPAHLDRV